MLNQHLCTPEETKSHIPPDPCSALGCGFTAPQLSCILKDGITKGQTDFQFPKNLPFNRFWAEEIDFLGPSAWSLGQRISVWSPQLLVTSVFKCPSWIKCIQIHLLSRSKTYLCKYNKYLYKCYLEWKWTDSRQLVGEFCRDSRQWSAQEFAFSLEVLACFIIDREIILLANRISDLYLSALCRLLCKKRHECCCCHCSSSHPPSPPEVTRGFLTEPPWRSRSLPLQRAQGGWSASPQGEGQHKGSPGTGWCFSILSRCGSPGICPSDIRGMRCTLLGSHPIQKWAGVNLSEEK